MTAKILGKNVRLLGDATLEEYQKLVEQGINRTAAHSLTNLVLQDGLPSLLMEDGTALLINDSSDGITIISGFGKNPALAIAQLCIAEHDIKVTIKGASEQLIRDIRYYHAAFFKVKALQQSGNNLDNKVTDRQQPTDTIDKLAVMQEICIGKYGRKRQIYHNLETYDILLSGAEYEKLRNAVNRAEREGVIVQKLQSDKLGLFGRLLDLWQHHKFYKLLKTWNESKLKILNERRKIAEEAGEEFTDSWTPVEWPAKVVRYLHTYCNPIEVYTASVPDKGIVAALGVGVYGESAFMYFRPQTFTVPKAMEYLEHKVFCELKARGVKTISRGIDGENTLNEYKKKMGILHGQNEYVMVLEPRISLQILAKEMAFVANCGLGIDTTKLLLTHAVKPSIVIYGEGKKRYIF